MKNKFVCGLAAVVLTCFSMNVVFAESTAPTKRQFRTWTVEKNTLPTAQSTSQATANKPDNKKQTPEEIQKPLSEVQKKEDTLKWKRKLSDKAKQKKNKQKREVKSSDTEKKNSTVVWNDAWRIKTTQQKLRQLGFLAEPPTGRITNGTKEALLSFQKKNDLPVTGKLDDRTYRRVNWLSFTKTGIRGITGDVIVKEASRYKGVPYVFGGITPKGFDCSGYVQYVFKKLNANLPRTADVQVLEGIFVTKSQLKPGDLVFFSTYEAGASHVGIYAGNGRFWNATSSKGVMLCGINEYYWGTRYYGARRVLVSNGEPGL